MELKIATRQWADDLGTLRSFHYFLTVDQVEAGTFCCENYGVRIMEEAGEDVAIPSITTSAVRIDELVTLLVDNHVSPTGLADVVADWL